MGFVFFFFRSRMEQGPPGHVPPQVKLGGRPIFRNKNHLPRIEPPVSMGRPPREPEMFLQVRAPAPPIGKPKGASFRHALGSGLPVARRRKFFPVLMFPRPNSRKIFGGRPPDDPSGRKKSVVTVEVARPSAKPRLQPPPPPPPVPPSAETEKKGNPVPPPWVFALLVPPRPKTGRPTSLFFR